MQQTGLHGGGDGRTGFEQDDDDDDDEELEDELLEEDELLDEEDEDSERGGGAGQVGSDPGRGRLDSQSECSSFRFGQGSFLTRLYR